MQKVISFTKQSNTSTHTFSFTNNRNIISIKIKLTNEYLKYSDKEIVVKYAINGVTTDLVLFGSRKLENQVIELKKDLPVAASHIFVTLENVASIISDISIYEDASPKKANYYPAYFDTDLKENYYLDSVCVFTTSKGYSNYSVYTSLDGRDFKLLATKQDEKPCDLKTGDIYLANGIEARIIRVYIEYNSEFTDALFDRIEFNGKKSGTEIQTRPEIKIPLFTDTAYHTEITPGDTYNEIYGIIERRLGAEYKDWFDFVLLDNSKDNKYDFFELSYQNKKILIKGNNGIALCVGLNHYIKYYCKVNISQLGDQTAMPKNIVPIDGIVYKETKAKIRYAYNYCTLSYSMAFWGEAEWQAELDWLALNGVNVVLDATAQEEVWRRFLTSIGYTQDEILKFIAGPAYYAWAYMANLSGFGGPVHDSWFYERTELARKNHLKMRKLGMCPVLQGYSGMVPNNITEHFDNIDIIPQGTWASFERPAMLRTTSPIFKVFAEKFYKAQAEVYGDYSIYYATDPFHEGGNMADMSAREISSEVLSAMLNANKNAVWIIQSWQNNPSSELLKGISDLHDGKKHALILDLYAEKDPNYKKGNINNINHGYSPEFDYTPWIFCMLNNFGGRLGLHGHIDNLNNWVTEAFNTCKSISGIGIAPEASFNNPVLYDFFFEKVWQDNADSEMKITNLNDWICNYCERRYGFKSESAVKAWEILLATVYKSEFNNLGQGAPESIINARPALAIKAASTWGNAVVAYDKKSLQKAAELLLVDYKHLQRSKGYQYDLITVLQQILSNYAQNVHSEMSKAYNARDIIAFKSKSALLLKTADLMEQVLACNKYYLLGRWVEQAKALAQNTDDFTKKLFELNSKLLITTWGSYNQCETGGLKDYSNRQWSGLIKDFYKPRWQRWINERIKELNGEPFEEKIAWFPWEWRWARQNTVYNVEPSSADILQVSQKILKHIK